jgi:hypothetical protein
MLFCAFLLALGAETSFAEGDADRFCRHVGIGRTQFSRSGSRSERITQQHGNRHDRGRRRCSLPVRDHLFEQSCSRSRIHGSVRRQCIHRDRLVRSLGACVIAKGECKSRASLVLWWNASRCNEQPPIDCRRSDDDNHNHLSRASRRHGEVRRGVQARRTLPVVLF